MKKISLIIGILLFCFNSINAQPEHRPEDYKKVEAYKTKFLTEELDLSTEEAQRFWPVYNEYNKKLQELFNLRAENLGRREIRDQWEKLDDSQLKEITIQELNKQKMIAQLKLDYYPKFEAAVGKRKAATFYRAEMEFRKHLVEMLGKRRRKRP